MKRLISMMLTLTLLLALSTFSGAAIPAQGDHVLHNTSGNCHSIESPASVNAEICPECGEQSLVYNCGGQRYVKESGTHSYGLFKTCSVDYTTSSTREVCNARGCNYSKSAGWHPFCDEYHADCGLGWYATCTVEYY